MVSSAPRRALAFTQAESVKLCAAVNCRSLWLATVTLEVDWPVPWKLTPLLMNPAARPASPLMAPGWPWMAPAGVFVEAPERHQAGFRVTGERRGRGDVVHVGVAGGVR